MHRSESTTTAEVHLDIPFGRMTRSEKREHVHKLWGKLRAAVHSGMAGWLGKHASESSVLLAAISVRDVVFPKFSVGDTLGLPSGVIPFVAAARFLRSFISSGGGGISSASTTEQNNEDKRRALACRLLLSQHGVACVTSAFWFVVLRRFRWSVEEHSSSNKKKKRRKTGHYLDDEDEFSTFSSMGMGSRPPSAMSNGSSSAGSGVNFSLRSVVSRQFDPPPTVNTEALQYAQGLLFNSSFHFGQIYAQHGSEIRTAATLQLFCQMFAATLLNFLKTEFWDATEDVEVGEGDQPPSGGADASSASAASTSAGDGGSRRRSPDGRRPRYVSTSSSDDVSLEQFVGSLAVSWFFGEQVGESLQALFSTKAYQGGGTSALEAALNAAAMAEDLQDGADDDNNNEKDSNFPDDNDGDDAGADDGAAENPRRRSSAKRRGEQQSHYTVPPRHRMDGFMKQVKQVDISVRGAQASSSSPGSPGSRSAPGSPSFSSASPNDFASVSGDNNNNSSSSPNNNSSKNSRGSMPVKFEGRRNHELLSQQMRAARSANKSSRDDSDEPRPSTVELIYKQFAQQQQQLVQSGAPRRAHASEVTDNMEELVHTQDGLSSIQHDDTNAKKREAFFAANKEHLDYCRARLKVRGVSVDEIKRCVPFPLSTRSQLLKLGELLAAHNVTGGANSNSSITMGNNSSRMSGRSPSPSVHHALFNESLARSARESAGTGMTNAFTPRPEASLALNSKDTAKRAGYDTTRKPTRCPFCHPNAHSLSLNVAAMKLTRRADKLAAKCRSCFGVKSGFLPMMTCTRCNAVLCVDCVRVVEVPVVEAVLTKAAMSAATRSFRDVVGQLWGREIAAHEFGPIAPPLTRARAGATLADLGAALTPLPRARPGSSASRASSASRQQQQNTSNTSTVAGGGRSTPLGMLRRQQQQQSPQSTTPLPTLNTAASSAIPSRAATPLPRAPPTPHQHQHQHGGGDVSSTATPGGVFNLTEANASRISEDDQSFMLHHTSASQQRQQQNNNNSINSHSRPTSAMDRLQRPGSAMSCCSWMAPGHLQGRIMRTGVKIDSEVFGSDDAAAQHASGIALAWKNRHLIKMTRLPDAGKGNLGRLRAHIKRSLAHARGLVDQAAADTERERAEAQQQTRRLKEMSSRDMIKQFRTEAQQAAQRLNGGTMDEHFHRRRVGGLVEAYAARFAGSGSAVHNPAQIKAAHGMLDEMAMCPSLGLLPAPARRRMLAFIAHERHCIGKAQTAAVRLKDLLSWSQAQGEEVELEDLLDSLELEEGTVAEIREALHLDAPVDASEQEAMQQQRQRQKLQKMKTLDENEDFEQDGESIDAQLAAKKRQRELVASGGLLGTSADESTKRRGAGKKSSSNNSNNVKKQPQQKPATAPALTAAASFRAEDLPPVAKWRPEEIFEEHEEDEVALMDDDEREMAFSKVSRRILTSINDASPPKRK